MEVEGDGPDAREKIFENFYSSDHGGLGIGLAISRSIFRTEEPCGASFDQLCKAGPIHKYVMAF